MRSALSRTCLLLLALTLASSPLLAAESPARPGFFAVLWRIVTEGVNEKLGSGMDPNGCPTGQMTGSDSDRGSGMDPNGRD